MRTYKDVAVPATTKRVLEKIVCDLCGKQALRGDWRSSTYGVDETEVEVTIHHRSGESYPEGGWGDEFQADLCPECFRDKLVPWLESQGAEAVYTVWED